ncbi:MAG: SOS response-associated peptidase [Desulfovibrio sp.]|nr:MAG: SOS response-associated peptidase [Desulfovibrio sp.]
MCGRFGFTLPSKQAMHRFGLDESVDYETRKNIAPTTFCFVVLARAIEGGDGFQRVGRLLKWGLVPSWSKDPTIGNRLINARSETAAEKPSFRAAFKRRRCLVPATAFYEWQKNPDGKQPFAINLTDQEAFAMAGLWEHWSAPDGSDLFTFTILTTEPNELLAPIHNRMPVILPEESWAPWLDPATDPKELPPLLASFPSKAMQAQPVSKAVNNPANQDF